jgi:Protein of unknown function (DUF3631)
MQKETGMPARKMSKKDRKRLEQLFRMIGSSNAGEAENARRLIIEMLARYRKTWNDLADLMKGGDTATGTWEAAYDDDRSKEQQAGDAINAGLPEAAVKEPNVLELTRFILEEYLDMKPHEHTAAALWVLYTHIFDRFTISPRLALSSPVNGCGKTTALAVIEQLAFRPERMDNATPAVIYHLIDRLNGTVLVDEADNLGLRENSILRAVLNSGHRKGGNIRRVIRGAPKKFSTFTPMAIAAIGALPLPLMRRSIIVHMEKTAGVAHLKRFDTNDSETMRRINIVYGFIRRWAGAKPKLDLDPELPKDLRTRVADNWRPLVAIADSFGPYWGGVARETAVTFAHAYHDEDVGVVLLSDLRDIFNRTSADRMTSIDLIATLLDIEESGWSEYRGARDDQAPRKFTQGEMARLLRPFGVRPRSIWPLTKRRQGTSSRKGYYRSQFESAWQRYCSTDGTTAQNSNLAYIGGR